jgi:hypothetical protein
LSPAQPDPCASFGFPRRIERHDGGSPDLARLLTALLERIEVDQARLIEERAQLQDEL